MKITDLEMEDIKRQTVNGVFNREYTSDGQEHEYQLRLETIAERLCKKRHLFAGSNSDDTNTGNSITINEIFDPKAKKFITQGVLEACESTGDVKEGNGYHMVCCPGHGDNNPSLRVKPKDDDETYCNLTCFASCSFKDIINGFKELCGDDVKATTSTHSEPVSQNNSGVETYDYTDADGKVLYRVIKRWDETINRKTFLQQTKKVNGQWINKLTVDPVLYKLPKVLKAIAEQKPVIIVEGEKDVHTLDKAFNDVTATTNSGGSGSWNDSYSEILKDAVRVFMIPDNDGPGLKHMESVATSLKTNGKDLYIINLPNIDKLGVGADITDWLEAGDIATRKQELKQAIKQAKPYTPDLSEFGIITGSNLHKMEIREHPWIIEKLIPVGLTNIFASEKVGKSVLAMQACLAVAQGKPLFGRLNVKQGRVLYLALEQGQQLNRNRIEKIDPGTTIPDTFHLVSAEDGWEQIDKGGLDKLKRYLIYHPDTKMVVIDVWQTIAPISGGNLNAYEKDSKNLKPLHQLANDKQIAVVFLHHKNKSYLTTDAFEKVSGSRAMLSVPDHLVTISRPPEDENGTLITKSRVGESEYWALKFKSDDDKLYWEYVGDAVVEGKSQERKNIIDILESCPEPLTIGDIVDLLKDEKGIYKTKGSVKRMLSRMFADDEVGRESKGVYFATTKTQADDENSDIFENEESEDNERNDDNNDNDENEDNLFQVLA